MLSLLKRKSDAAAAPLVPAWHPNFRHVETLPDIKPIRTAFFVNGAAIFITLALAVYFGLRELQLRQLHAQIVAADQQIARTKKDSDAAVAQFKKFQAEESKIKEVDAFLKARPIVSDLLLHLGETAPENIAFDLVDVRENGLVLRLSVRGTPVTGSGYADAYVRQLQADKVLLERYGPATLTNISLNPATGRMVAEILVPNKGASK